MSERIDPLENPSGNFYEDLSRQVNKELEPTLATSAEIDELYDRTDRYLFLKRDEIKVTPSITAGMLIETIDTQVINGLLLRISRERPAYIDDPTRVAEETPLSMVDEEGRNIYHTPVEIEVLKAGPKNVLQHFSIMNSGPNGEGKNVAGFAIERDRALDEDLGRILSKTGGEMTKAELSDVMKFF